MTAGFVVWFTGLSGAGKSTLAAMLSAELRARGVHVEVLDGDEVRTHLSKGLSFSKEDRDTNVRRIGYVAKLIARSGACAMTAAISPYRAIRDEQRAQVGRFVEVYCRCDIPVLAGRDAKGLYKKALAGEIKHFTGIDDPYEPPLAPEVTVDTGAESKEQSLGRILAKLEELGYAPPRGGPGGAFAQGGAAGDLVAPHGGDLVDRFARGAERDALVERSLRLPAIDLDARAERDLEMIATGAFSPLKGFMNSKDYLRVVREMRLENGLPWPLPVTLSITEADAERVEVSAQVALRARDGRIVAVMDVSDQWRPDRDIEAREGHGVAGAVYVGGEIHALERRGAQLLPKASAEPVGPRETRAIFAARGLRRIVGFQVEGAFSRAHEYISKAALELADGLLLHVPVDAAAPDAIPAAVRVRGCEAVIAGYYPPERVVLAPYLVAPRNAGPREAVLQALVSKNHGASHVLVGRARDAEAAAAVVRAFGAFSPGELGVEPLFVEEEVFHAPALGGPATAKTAPGGVAARVSLAEGRVRELLARGEALPEELVRPEVAQILQAWARGA